MLKRIVRLSLIALAVLVAAGSLSLVARGGGGHAGGGGR